jgi:phosphoribosylglycinamide formyltransferase-1
MSSLLTASQNGSCHIDIAAVISNRLLAPGLQNAAQAGVATECIDHTEFDSRASFDASLAERITSYEPELVILAGFMRILTPEFTRQFEGRMLNIHPSLLPKYPGLNTHQRAIDAGDTEHGASVHFVTAELDGGPVAVQSVVPVLKGDNADSLAERVLSTEHQLYTVAADWFGRGLLKMVSNKGVLCEQNLKKPVILRNAQLEGIEPVWHKLLTSAGPLAQQ